MSYKIISFNHQNNSIKIREKLSFSESSIVEFVKRYDLSDEIVILSTCNRVECITYGHDTNKLFSALSSYFKIDTASLKQLASVFEDDDAIKHFFSVISSLESIVLGETQIVSQIKSAFDIAVLNNHINLHLPRLLAYGLKVSAHIRSATQISKTSVSISSVAVDYAKDFIGGNIGGFSAIVVGAGSVAKLLVKNLIKNRVNVIIVNRTLENAKKISDEMGGEMIRIVSYDKLPELVNRYRLLFSCTSSESIIIHNKMVKDIEFNRFWFDLAIPRDIEDISNDKIKILRIDDLKTKSDENYQYKLQKRTDAYVLIGKHLIQFHHQIKSFEVEPLIKELRLKAKEISLSEIRRFMNKGYIHDAHSDELEKLLHASFNKFLHRATSNLRKISTNKDADMIVQSIKTIFEIDNE